MDMKKVLAAVCAAASLALAACSDAPEPAADPPPSSGSVTTSASPASPAPDPGGTGETPQTLRFTATTVDGKTFDAAALAGKPAVLWFWAAWCPRCRGDAAEIRDLQQQYAGKAGVVGVAGLGSGAAAMKDFVADYRLDGFPQLADDAGKVWQRFEVPSQHYYVILDSSGKVAHSGPLTVAQLKQKVDGLL
ncbi:redoxin domain-containing protein [Catellatospora coxensis]|uniref:Thioredoxin domain-containing protein n=1 Tax=Catellatospora coxensis TaxID=310354 RepID=A0A8J3P6T7_9ACTN|nr:hypothetical protein Cco03nite_28960 [Catellatospora coxensis]